MRSLLQSCTDGLTVTGGAQVSWHGCTGVLTQWHHAGTAITTAANFASHLMLLTLMKTLSTMLARKA